MSLSNIKIPGLSGAASGSNSQTAQLQVQIAQLMSQVAKIEASQAHLNLQLATLQSKFALLSVRVGYLERAQRDSNPGLPPRTAVGPIT